MNLSFLISVRILLFKFIIILFNKVYSDSGIDNYWLQSFSSMPPTRNIRTCAEIAEANQALIARRRQRLHVLQNPTASSDPTDQISGQGQYYFHNIFPIKLKKIDYT